MARRSDPAALLRLHAPLRSTRPTDPSGPTAAPAPPMGYQPALDGLRSLAIVLVLVYHAGTLGSPLDIGPGGFIGVEVFFVVSGYLITALLVEEWRRAGRIDLGRFWLRRARRLLPALGVMLVAAVALATVLDESTLGGLRGDLLGAVFYVSNWQQIFGDVGYFGGPSTPPLLRHLWSLAIEEQWYLIWPVVFAALMRRAAGHVERIRPVLVVAAVATALAMPLAYVEFDAFRVNLAYLATFTRVSGLLFGAALALTWTPWRWRGAGARRLVGLDVAGFAALLGLFALGAGLHSTTPGAYETKLFLVAGPAVLPGGLFLVSVLSAVAIAAAVHPGAVLMHRVFGHRVPGEFGKRSYGLYLWHWPLFVLLDAGDGWIRLALALAVSVVATEVSYRFVERPVRAGALAAWFRGLRAAHGAARQSWVIATAVYGLAAVMVLAAVTVRLVRTDSVSIEVDRRDVRFDATAITTPRITTPLVSSPAGATIAPSPVTIAVPVTTAPKLPRRLVLVGDSQAHSMAVNTPLGLDSTFVVANGGIQGCSVWAEGRVRTSRSGVNKNFGECSDVAARWKGSAVESDADVAVVVLGAWDVFDLEIDDELLTFGSEAWDRQFGFRLDQGVEALKSAGAGVALLEVPCMRPVDVPGAAVPALPERADDERVAHVNELLRAAAADDPRFVTFVPGPPQWCADEAIATDLGYRWDGVHVYKPGAKLIFETVAASLLRIPV